MRGEDALLLATLLKEDARPGGGEWWNGAPVLRGMLGALFWVARKGLQTSSRSVTIQVLRAFATRQDRLFSDKQTLEGRFGCMGKEWLQLQGILSKFLSSGG